MQNSTINLKPTDNLDDIIKQNKNVLLDFTASWCGPCKKLGPILDEKAKSQKFTLVKVDIDENNEVAEKYNISGIPHVILMIDGKPSGNFTGFNEQALEDLINKL